MKMQTKRGLEESIVTLEREVSKNGCFDAWMAKIFMIASMMIRRKNFGARVSMTCEVIIDVISPF